MLPLPTGAKAKDVSFKLSSKAVQMSALGQPLLSGDFFHPVRADDSIWELEDAPDGGRRVRVSFAKATPNRVWDCCFVHEVDETVTTRCFMDVAIGGRRMGESPRTTALL